MRKRVMIIEDNDITRKALVMYVKEEALDAIVDDFDSVENAYEAALVNEYCLFLVDIVIRQDVVNDTSGIKFVDRIRTIDKYRFTPVVFITSLEDPAMYAFNELHSYAYIEKPFEESYVRKTIANALLYTPKTEIDKTLFFRTEGILFPVKVSEILYAEYVNRGVDIYKTDGNMLRIPYMNCTKVIKEEGEICLIQCNRSTIINRKHVEYIDSVNGYIKLKNKPELINIGITYSKKINEEFRNGIGSGI